MTNDYLGAHRRRPWALRPLVEEIRLVRRVRDRLVENAQRQGMTADKAHVVAKVVLYREFLQRPYPTPTP